MKTSLTPISSKLSRHIFKNVVLSFFLLISVLGISHINQINTVKKKLKIFKTPTEDLELGKTTKDDLSLRKRIVRFVKHVLLGK